MNHGGHGERGGEQAKAQSPRATTERRLAALAAIALLAGAAFALSRLGYRPNAGPDVFDSPAAFDRYVAELRLETLALEQAGVRLGKAGFRCELLAPGNLSCYRKVRGSNCGERQFVDLASGDAGTNRPGEPQPAGTLRISTRFGLTCD